MNEPGIEHGGRVKLGICKAMAMVVVLSAGAGCTSDATTSSSPTTQTQQEKATGTLALGLTSTDTQGREYHLRNATFTISPAYYWYDGGLSPAQTISTETNPDSNHLSMRLVPGEYTVTLADGWYIERSTASGVERVQKVVLLSPSTQYAYVTQDWSTELEFRIGVDGDLIDFRHGDLNVDVAIELPQDHQYDGGYDAGVLPYYDAGYAFDGGYYR